MILRVASAAALSCFTVFAATTAGAEPRAVLELFTSQGCSSCPPADKLLAEFAHDPNILAMSLPVDYWDYLGWKDTLALAGHTRRQRAYAHVRGDREVYTPQVVVNGIAHALGSDRAAIQRAIQRTRQTAAPLSEPLTIAIVDDKVTVNLPAATNQQISGEVWLCPISKSIPIEIGRGENRGRTITYSNVVRRWIKLGDWNGKAATFSIPVREFQHGEIDEVAVLLQSGIATAPKLMLGAAEVAVR